MKKVFAERYLLIRPLGQGAMGEVFLAMDTRTGKRVALKRLRGVASALQMSALRREVGAVAQLRHPNLVHVLDIGQGEEGQYFTMDFIPGRPLTHWMGHLSHEDLAEVLDQILAGLAFAHARGVVHLDLKPDNIMILEAPDGALTPKLVDFGVAEVGGLQGRPVARVEEGAFYGTPSYMAPEQIRGERHLFGPETDLYAFGVILYELVAGKRPFEAYAQNELLLMHLFDEPPRLDPQQVRERSGELSRLISRLLEKSPFSRPSCAADVRRVLKKLEWAETAPTRMVRTRSAPEVDEYEEELDKTLFEAPASEDEAPVKASIMPLRDLPLCGRGEASDWLWSQVRQTLSAGSMQEVWIQGEPGIGKSRLLRWLVARVEEEGVMKALGGGVGPNATFPPGSPRDALERHFRVVGVEDSEVEGVLREQLVMAGMSGQEIKASARFLRPQRVAEGVDVSAAMMGVRLLHAASSIRPLLLVFDDLTEEESAPVLELLRLLRATKELFPVPVLVVMTTRATMKWQAGALLELGPLGDEGARALAHASLPMTSRLASFAAAHARGNPARLRQLLGLWHQTGEITEDEKGRYRFERGEETDALPQGSFALFERLVDVLLEATDTPQLDRALLARSALCGPRFSSALLGALLKEEGLSAHLSALDNLTRRLLEAGVWQEVSKGLLQFTEERFRAEVSTWFEDQAVKARAHLSLAKFKGGAARSPQDWVQVAEHLLAAGHLEGACRTLLDASSRSFSGGDLTSAQQIVARAESLLNEEELEGALALTDEMNLLLAKIATRSGDFDRAEGSLRQVRARKGALRRGEVLAEARRLEGDLALRRGALVEAELHFKESMASHQLRGDLQGLARSKLGLAEVYATMRRSEQVLELAREARLAFEEGEVRWVARCLVLEGHGARLQGELQLARRSYLHALESFEEVGAPLDAARTRIWLGDLLSLDGELEEAIFTLERAQRELSYLGALSALSAASRGLVIALRKQGRLQEGEEVCLRGLEVSKAMGDKLGEARMRNDLGKIYRAQKRRAEAASEFQEAREACLRCDALSSAAICAANLAALRAEEDHWLEARESFAEAVELAGRGDDARMRTAYLFGLVWCEAERGDWCSAWSTLQKIPSDWVPVSDVEFTEELSRVRHLAEEAGQEELIARLDQLKPT